MNKIARSPVEMLSRFTQVVLCSYSEVHRIVFILLWHILWALVICYLDCKLSVIYILVFHLKSALWSDEQNWVFYMKWRTELSISTSLGVLIHLKSFPMTHGCVKWPLIFLFFYNAGDQTKGLMFTRQSALLLSHITKPCKWPFKSPLKECSGSFIKPKNQENQDN